MRQGSTWRCATLDSRVLGAKIPGWWLAGPRRSSGSVIRARRAWLRQIRTKGIIPYLPWMSIWFDSAGWLPRQPFSIAIDYFYPGQETDRRREIFRRSSMIDGEGRGGRDILIRWRSIIRTGFDIYILRRRIDEFSLGFGDGRRFWREREGDCNVTSRDLGRNVCPLEEGFHINCFTKSVHKVWCNVIPFYALLDHIYIYIPGEICNVSWKHSSYTGIQGRCFEVALALKKAGKKECNR